MEHNVSAGGIVHLALTARHASPDWMVASVTPMRLMRDIDIANAERLALAWNCHDELISILQRVVNRFDPFDEGDIRMIREATSLIAKATHPNAGVTQAFPKGRF